MFKSGLHCVDIFSFLLSEAPSFSFISAQINEKNAFAFCKSQTLDRKHNNNNNKSFCNFYEIRYSFSFDVKLLFIMTSNINLIGIKLNTNTRFSVVTTQCTYPPQYTRTFIAVPAAQMCKYCTYIQRKNR